MALDNTLSSLLETLTASLQSATEVLPTGNILPPKDGISLLDVKNDLLLSYLQNLVFLILLKIRSRSQSLNDQEALSPHDDVVQKLVELRIYLDKGVRPLENRLKYQIENLIGATENIARMEQKTASSKETGSRAHRHGDSDASDMGSVEPAQIELDVGDSAHGPRTAAFVPKKSMGDKRSAESSKDGIYRPPKITPTTMPTTQGREEKERRKPGRSATLDEFVATELSAAPIAQPSIGSTIMAGGRRTKSEKERREETERREYEESNLVRLPPESKRDRAKNGGSRNGGWGGEEWRGLGAGLDRIERLTQKKGGSLGSLERSRKRPVQDGPRGTGSSAGDAFEKRRKVVARYRK
ncbi:hypothetical protein BDV95DRAFT_561469 [Massariosphaeria phaeospora]|uniref:Sas10/Utp3/C1D family-domain-containing protein n=1 Tax=Massariosphaeria phaeospora TaxID=100035 RepID=A0A7C8MM61_9PLEO|nr:hypothetical protein BDV95DRAFT_561469 [Massariosphaeria phaeospora]